MDVERYAGLHHCYIKRVANGLELHDVRTKQLLFTAHGKQQYKRIKEWIDVYILRI